MFFSNAEEFYPTPVSLLEKITVDIDWKMVNTILEPSAGKGDIAEFVQNKIKNRYGRYGRYGGYDDSSVDIDCIEINSDLRNILIGKNFRVVHDDFLTFNTFKKYDLIIMNPPFSNGDAHLAKALEIQKDGGCIICILNAETLKNLCTNRRKALMKQLDSYDAIIEYMTDEFTVAERKTDVEIAVVKVVIPEKPSYSTIIEDLKKKTYSESFNQDITDVAPSDFVKAIVQRYNMEVECGLKLMQEYRAMRPWILTSLHDSVYNAPILEMKIGKEDLSNNLYVKRVRMKYWCALFENPKFTGSMTTNLLEGYRKEIEKLADYDFSEFNIRTIQIDISKHLIRGIEDCIIGLFDELSFQHSYDDDLKNNIHYYNGWKTNKAWYINKKVIIPYMNAWGMWGYDPSWNVEAKLADIEKVLNYLDGGRTEAIDLRETLKESKESGQTRKIRFKYFYASFYKKGTCHIEFIDMELLKKFNIFGSQQKKWLPPGYGKRKYSDMTQEEKAVIDDFEGKESYENVVNNPQYYIYEPAKSIPMLEMVS